VEWPEKTKKKKETVKVVKKQRKTKKDSKKVALPCPVAASDPKRSICTEWLKKPNE
jgi:hypothetical protein